jgi:hypothetical protein
MIVAEQATEAVPPHHMPCLTATCPFRRDEAVIEPLVIALCMIEFVSIKSSAAKGEDGPGIMEDTAEVPPPIVDVHHP